MTQPASECALFGRGLRRHAVKDKERLHYVLRCQSPWSFVALFHCAGAPSGPELKASHEVGSPEVFFILVSLVAAALGALVVRGLSCTCYEIAVCRAPASWIGPLQLNRAQCHQSIW